MDCTIQDHPLILHCSLKKLQENEGRVRQKSSAEGVCEEQSSLARAQTCSCESCNACMATNPIGHMEKSTVGA
jgi:hypothetical protein